METKPILNQKREINVNQINNSIDDSTRTVKIAFMSQEPVKRDIDGKLYNEIILTTPGAVDLTRLNNGGALLYNHNHDWLIGVVESASIDADKVGRALVRFSTDEFADKKYKQVQESVLTKISFGYNILDYYFEGENLYVTKVQPYEISFVSIAADDQVGVARYINKEEETNTYKDHLMDKDDKEEVLVEEEVVEEDEVAVEEDKDDVEVHDIDRELEEAKAALLAAKHTSEVEKELESIQAELQAIEDAKAEKVENSRKREIEAIALAFDMDPSKALNSTVSVEDFKRGIETQKEKLKTNINVKDNNMNNKRTIDSLVAFAKGDQTALNELKSGVRGYEIQPGEFAQLRANTTTVTAKGAVQQDYADDFIAPLLEETILGRLGIELLSGMQSREFTIPRLSTLSSATSFKFYSEGDAMEETVAGFDSITMKPRMFAGAIPVTKSLMLSSPNIGMWVQKALMDGVANSLEQEVIKEVERKAIHVETAVADTLSEADIEGALQQLLEANIRTADMCAIVSPSMYAKLRQTAYLVNTSGVALAQGMRLSDSQWLIEEMPLIVSNFVSDDTILMGDFHHVVIASWTGSTLDVDTTTYRSSLTTVFRNYNYCDIALKRQEAVIKLTIKAA